MPRTLRQKTPCVSQRRHWLGFPWYFKFNSAELRAVAQSIAGERGTAPLTYYGWRIRIFSIVPNVTNINRSAPDEEPPILWFNFGFAAVVIGGTALLGFWIRSGVSMLCLWR
jgi:hypothetical protein